MQRDDLFFPAWCDASLKYKWLRGSAFVLLLVLWSTALLAQTGDPVGRVAAVTNEAVVIRDGQPGLLLNSRDAVYVSDIVQTRNEALLEIEMNDGSRFTLDENTRVAMREYVTEAEPRGFFSLVRGRLRSLISSTFSSRADAFQVETNEGVMGVQGTEFQVDALFKETRVYVYTGVVSVTSRDPNFPEPRVLRAGQSTRVREGEPVAQPVEFLIPPSAAAQRLLGSGSSQDIQSAGDQWLDPTTVSPEAPAVMLPPEPNPPSRDGRDNR